MFQNALPSLGLTSLQYARNVTTPFLVPFLYFPNLFLLLDAAFLRLIIEKNVSF